MITVQRFGSCVLFVVLGLCGLLIGSGRSGAVVMAEGGVVIGMGTAASCQSNSAVNAFSAAVAAGGTIDFDCGPNQVFIPVNTNITNQTVTINGKGLIYLDGENLRQVFYLQSGGNLTLNDMKIFQGSASQGAGIYIEPSAAVEINGGLVINNSASGAGGAIYNNGFLSMNYVQMYNNNSGAANGGGIYNNGGGVIINNSRLIYNDGRNGGGVYSSNGQLIVNSSTFYGNSVTNDGGGIYVDGPTQLINSTFSWNQALRGGGFFLKGNATFLNTTVYKNRADEGGGIWNEPGSNSSLKNSIVAYSFVTAGGTSNLNCDGPAMISQGRNIFNDGTCLPNPGTNGDLFQTPPKLGAWSGIGVWAFTPDPDSPAIDYGLDCPETDQRGFPRPLGVGCDVGSIEFGGVALLPAVIR